MPNTFNENGVCIDPEIPYQHIPKKTDFADAYIKIAEHPEGGWCYGYGYPNGCCPCAKHYREGLYQSREVAIKKALDCLANVINGQVLWYGKAVSFKNEGGDSCGYGATYKNYKQLQKIVAEWIAKESEPIQLSLF